ncbi:MAG: UDP-2,3-diacylglucosamine diphosphatase [Bacteroidetes bacterium]|nr:UDP-2,3-diacylglucosamine diphosphatase [Bacteroidota bacterium]MBS1629303.1 UDP-2,3-diacylglucosamine diphosphatase [Bacteroidota bacterium]
MQLADGKKVYFASDFHLGIPNRESSLEREKRLCRWMDIIREDAALLYLVGDIFDVWFEYKNVIPKGYTRFLGKLAELRDAGLSIEAFTGNHDLWMRGYFEEELGIPVYHAPIRRSFNDRKFFIGHGDGLGPGDQGYKLLKKTLNNPVLQWLYRRIHPDTGVGLAGWASRLGPKHNESIKEEFLGPEKEFLIQYCNDFLKTEPMDYFVFGHRHLPLDYPLSGHARYINLGDWIRYDSYAVFDGKELELKFFGNEL